MNMYSYKVLSELGNGSLETCADTRLVASDGASVRVHWPLLVARGVWWTRSADQDRVEDGDKVIIFNGVTIQELRKFDSEIYCDFPCYGWNPLDIPKRLKISAGEEDNGDCLVQWGGATSRQRPRQGSYRSGWWPPPPPPPGLSDNSDCVLAKSAEVGTVPLAEEAAIQSEAGVTSPVPEWVSEKLFVNSIRRKEGI